MALSDVTDPKAVRSALAEFDSVGRDAFLEKYGFGKARSYFIQADGRRYDSKAIVGAAHGYQYPESGSLGPQDFSGGDAAAVRVLRKLGFEVLNLGRRSRVPMHWAFCANPERYRIAEAVRNLEIDLWTVGRSDVRAGDSAVLWQTLDHRGVRGIVGFATVLEDPQPRPDDGNPYWIDPQDGSQLLPRVSVRYDVPEELPIWVDDPTYGPLLKSLSVARAQGGTVFRITGGQWEELQTAVGGWRPAPPEELEATTKRPTGGNGQGFGLTGPERRAVEIHAMQSARKHFEQTWPVVEDVSGTCSFDLLCRDGDSQLRVEVKGTTTAGESVILTKNEVTAAKEPGYALYVVSEIELKRDQTLQAHGGRCRVYDPWDVGSARLVPISYRCELNLEAGEELGALDQSGANAAVAGFTPAGET